MRCLLAFVVCTFVCTSSFAASKKPKNNARSEVSAVSSPSKETKTPRDRTQYPVVSREDIEKELESAEKEFDDARKMFNPWYAGPLLTPSPHIIDAGLWNTQPYLFVTNNHREYTRSGKSVNVPNKLQVKLINILQVGIVRKLEALLTVGGVYNHLQGRHSTNITDTQLALGYAVNPESAYKPAVAFQIQESFPTGKYRNLNPDKLGVDATGSGSFQTRFGLTIGKVIWWVSTHPMNTRISFNYTIPAPTTVKNFNAYGGGYGTHGTVNPGNTFELDMGYEYSFTQKWVIACDFVYNYTSPTHFSGRKGVLADGTTAFVGGPFNDQFSLAPAIEYNPTANLGFLLGAWFTVWGRNSSDFYSGVFTVEYTF